MADTGSSLSTTTTADLRFDLRFPDRGAGVLVFLASATAADFLFEDIVDEGAFAFSSAARGGSGVPTGVEIVLDRADEGLAERKLLCFAADARMDTCEDGGLLREVEPVRLKARDGPLSSFFDLSPLLVNVDSGAGSSFRVISSVSSEPLLGASFSVSAGGGGGGSLVSTDSE